MIESCGLRGNKSKKIEYSFYKNIIKNKEMMTIKGQEMTKK